MLGVTCRLAIRRCIIRRCKFIAVNLSLCALCKLCCIKFSLSLKLPLIRLVGKYNLLEKEKERKEKIEKV